MWVNLAKSPLPPIVVLCLPLILPYTLKVRFQLLYISILILQDNLIRTYQLSCTYINYKLARANLHNRDLYQNIQWVKKLNGLHKSTTFYNIPTNDYYLHPVTSGLGYMHILGIHGFTQKVDRFISASRLVWTVVQAWPSSQELPAFLFLGLIVRSVQSHQQFLALVRVAHRLRVRV